MQESSKNHLNHAESTPKFDFLPPVPDNKPNFCCAQMYSDFLGVSVQFSFGVDLSAAEASRTATNEAHAPQHKIILYKDNTLLHRIPNAEIRHRLQDITVLVFPFYLV